MANPKGGPAEKRFKPGQSGNPGGKPRGLLTRAQVEACMGTMASMSREELQEVISNKKSTMLQIMVASIMAQAAKLGDPNRMEFLLQRTIGKVADNVNLHQDTERIITLAYKTEPKKLPPSEE